MLKILILNCFQQFIVTITNSLCALRWNAEDDVGVSGISDCKGAHTEETSTGGSELNVVSVVVVNSSFGEHGVVLNLGLSEWWSVVGNDDKLSLSVEKGFESLLVSEDVLSSLHDHGESGVDVLSIFLDLWLSSWSHDDLPENRKNNCVNF